MLSAMNNSSAHSLATVGRSSAGQPRTLRLERLSGSRQGAYRRLMAAILRLDVASLGNQLRTERLGRSLPRAA
jgi:hypothetical protein